MLIRCFGIVLIAEVIDIEVMYQDMTAVLEHPIAFCRDFEVVLRVTEVEAEAVDYEIKFTITKKAFQIIRCSPRYPLTCAGWINACYLTPTIFLFQLFKPPSVSTTNFKHRCRHEPMRFDEFAD